MKNPFSFLNLIFLSIIISILPPAYIQADEGFKDLIKKVQQNSQRSYDEINAISYKGHSKTYIYFAYRPFMVKMIPYLDEYYFDGIWMKPDSIRLVITAQRTVLPDTEGVKIGEDFPLPNPFQFTYDPSAIGLNLADSTAIWPLYPFAIGADSIYEYHKVNEISFGDNKILTVSVVPVKENIPAVSGTFQIDVNKHVVVSSDVTFNEAATYLNTAVNRQKNKMTLSVSGSENHQVRTEKTLLWGSYWLPTVVEEDFDIRIWGITAKINRIIEFSDYVVHEEIPDSSIFENQRIVHKPEPEMERKLFTDTPYPNRLTKAEQEQLIEKIEDQFSSIDLFKDLFESESIAAEAMRMGMEQRFGRYFQLIQRLTDYVLFNRVEGFRLSYGFNLSNLITRNSSIALSAGYGLQDERWKGQIALLQFLDPQKKFFLETNSYQTMGYEEERRLITSFKNTFTSLLYKGDYRDYYYKSGLNIGMGYRATDNLAVKLSYIAQAEGNAQNESKISLFKRNDNFRFNPQIVEGVFRGMRGSIIYRTYDMDFNLLAEYTDMKQLHSDFSYSYIKTDLRRCYKPTYHSELTLFGSADISFGKLAPQRWFDFGGKTFLNYFGNLRGVDYKEFTGDRMVYGTIEYAINGSAFYDQGLKSGFIKLFKFTVWSGLGWSSLSGKNKTYAMYYDVPKTTTDGMYHEIGIGFGDALNILRVDFINNSIEKNKILISFNVLR